MKATLTSILLVISFVVDGQQSIFVTIAGGDLYKLNLTNCDSTFIGSTGIGFGDIAFTNDGKLWGIAAGDLYEIDTITALTNFVGNTGLSGVSLVGASDTSLFIEDATNLFSLKVSDASVVLIGSIGYSSCGDLTWYDNDLYMTTCDQLIKISLDATYSSIVSVSEVNSVADPIPGCEGIITASFPNANNIILGFSGAEADVYKICQIDGTYELWCSAILPGGVPGGASIKLLPQIPEPITCPVLSSSDFFNSPTSVEFYPNPCQSVGTIVSEHELQNASVVIYDLLGNVVFRMDAVNGKSIPVSTESIISGLYYIRIHQYHDSKIISLIKFSKN